MVEHHAKALAELAGGVRLATAAYLDELADAARTLGGATDRLRAEAEALTARLSGAPGDPRDPLARAVWEVVALLQATGKPGRVGEAIGAAAGAVDALAGDVVESLRVAREPRPGVRGAGRAGHRRRQRHGPGVRPGAGRGRREGRRLRSPARAARGGRRGLRAPPAARPRRRRSTSATPRP